MLFDLFVNSIVGSRNITDDPVPPAFNAIETIMYMETSNPSNLPDGLKIFLNDWGDQNDWEYHMETMQAEFQTQPHVNPGQRGDLETIPAQTLHIPPPLEILH